MSRNQRLTFLGIAAVIAVVAVVVLAGGGSDDEGSGEQASSTQTATPSATESGSEETATPTPTPTPTPKPPTTLAAGSVKKLRFKEGGTVRFRVRSDEAEEIHVHGYDIEREVPAGETISVSFKATITGIFEIEFHHSGEQIGELRVDPK